MPDGDTKNDDRVVEYVRYVGTKSIALQCCKEPVCLRLDLAVCIIAYFMEDKSQPSLVSE